MFSACTLCKIYCKSLHISRRILIKPSEYDLQHFELVLRDPSMIYYNFGIALNHKLCIENIKLAMF